MLKVLKNTKVNGNIYFYFNCLSLLVEEINNLKKYISVPLNQTSFILDYFVFLSFLFQQKRTLKKNLGPPKPP